LSKDKDNVIPFPGTKVDTKDTIDKLNDELLMQKEEVEMIESTIDEVAIDLIRRLVDIGIDINKKEFYGDLAMITELVRGLIYRDFKREHLATVLIDKIIDIQYNEKGEVQPVINYSRVLEQKDMPGQEGEKEIHFEPDFEIPIPPEDDDK
jgi:hypothetical protein|tara:strand:- start:128 stop:580 length:453 start_codon:yes stop_codon:yes gene_type:complete